LPTSDPDDAATRADDRVRTVEDSAAGRLQLAAEFYRDGGRQGFGRAELRFLRWAIGRGVLRSPAASRPGSPWWRALNGRLLRDKVESHLLDAGAPGRPSSPSVVRWLDFIRTPSPVTWYCAHNASIAAGYLEHEALARRELVAERFVINVALARVLFTHAMVTRPRLVLGAAAAVGPRLADPRRGGVDVFLDLRRSFPEEYPLTGTTVADLVRREGHLPRAIDYGVILPRITAVYAFARHALDQPRIADLIDGREPCYALAPGHWAGGAAPTRRLLPRLAAWMLNAP